MRWFCYLYPRAVLTRRGAHTLPHGPYPSAGITLRVMVFWVEGRAGRNHGPRDLQ